MATASLPSTSAASSPSPRASLHHHHQIPTTPPLHTVRLPPRPSLISSSPAPPPPLRSSFPPSLHPLYDTVRSVCDPWILHVANPPSPAHRQFLLDCLLPRYVCRILSTAPLLPRICATTKIIAWFTLADDVADDAANSGAVEQWSRSVLSVLEDPAQWYRGVNRKPVEESEVGEGGGAASRLLEALAEVWGEIGDEMHGQARERFIRAAKEHLEAVVLQSAIRARGGAAAAELTTEAFMAIRRPASGFPMGLELVPYTLSIGVDAHQQLLLRHPLLVELRSLAVDYMCICNDVLSLGVETAKGDYFNLPCVLYGGGVAATLAEATECAAQMAGVMDARCVELVAEIRRDRALVREEGVERYVATLVAWMAGTIEWSYESARYGLPLAKAAGG